MFIISSTIQELNLFFSNLSWLETFAITGHIKIYNMMTFYLVRWKTKVQVSFVFYLWVQTPLWCSGHLYEGRRKEQTFASLSSFSLCSSNNSLWQLFLKLLKKQLLSWGKQCIIFLSKARSNENIGYEKWIWKIKISFSCSGRLCNFHVSLDILNSMLVGGIL